jgi:hypothetical protein
LQPEFSRRQAANNYAGRQAIELRELLESLAGEVTVPGSMTNGNPFVQL